MEPLEPAGPLRPEEPAEPAEPAEPVARRKKRGRVLVPLLLVAVLAGAGAVAVARPWDRGTGGTERDGVEFGLAPVEQGSLSSSIQLTGSLVYDAPTPVLPAGRGTLTGLPAVGAVVKAGQRLYEVDGQPVVLMVGDRPMWRDLGPGVPAGSDVEQLKRNLLRLGHAKGLGLAADRKFTPDTATAVKRWQKSLGLKETGTVPLGGITMLPQESVRVQQVGAQLGAALAGSPVMTVTREGLVVTAQPAENQLSRFKPDGRVRVKLADGSAVDGRIRSLIRGSGSGSGSGGEGGGSGEGQGQGQGGAKTTVTIVLDAQEQAQRAGQSTVSITVVGDTAEHALIVPVTALLALDGGGYGVRVSDGPTPRLVKVQLGLIADAKAQITGDVRPGAQVVIPK
ncbi:peptidoglycan-binding protein [Streptomyces sp. NBC_00335]|uniref:peptidoglycan-binding protein n=1 Tax=unclassified Streptomyces TaxID=2593676 RepID=UPI0022527732|nr:MULTISPECIES: peptidoglycan-binding protein [unclassified Streptomyces]MCX5403726.1 peptidoglycan-binding protein [Streptomyces sp. NBC_00086]